MFTLAPDLCKDLTNKGQEGKQDFPSCKRHKTHTCDFRHTFGSSATIDSVRCASGRAYAARGGLLTSSALCSTLLLPPRGGGLSWPLSAMRKAIVPEPNCLKEVLPSAEQRCHPVLLCTCPEMPPGQEGGVGLLPGRSFF